MGRYFVEQNNARTMMQRAARTWGTGTQIPIRGFRGFGQTDPITGGTPDSIEQAANAAQDMAAATEGDVVTDVGGEAVVDVAPVCPPAKTDFIEFFPDGSTFSRGTISGVFWRKLAASLGVPEGEGRGPDGMVQMADDLTSSRSFWKWAALLGVPVVGVATWFAAKKWAR